MRELDFSPLFRSAIGFDRLPSLFDELNRSSGVDSYPPYNIEKAGEDAYRISVAVAGFGENDLNVEVKDQTLVVTGKREDGESATYLHRGIAGRAFERRFRLADHVEVKGADLVNGLLVLDLVREIPEAMKPRQIEIRSGADGKVLEHKAA